jgi:hypothetical protein
MAETTCGEMAMSTTVRQFPDYPGKSIFILASLVIVSVCGCSGGGDESASNTEPATEPPLPTAELSDLAVTGTTLIPAFDASERSYYASIDMDQPSATIIARTVDSGATIHWPTQTDTAHGVYTVNVEPGETHINIKVIASDSSEEIMYTLYLHRPSADLAHLGIGSEIFSLTPSFDPDVLNYSVAVRLEDASVMILATTVDPWAEIHWPTHIDRQYGNYLVDLVVGENTVKIPVVANEWGREGIAEKSYTLTLIRAPINFNTSLRWATKFI